MPQCAVGHAGISHLFAPPSSAYRVNDRVQGGIQPYSLLTKKKERQRQPIKDRAESESRSVMSDSLQPHGLYSPWNSPGLNTGVGSRSLLQWIFPTQGWNSGLPHCRWTLYQLSHKGSPRILEWVAYPFSSGSSWPVNRTRVSCAACGFFINWALREAQRQAWGLAYRFQKWLPQWPTPLTGHNCDIQARLDTRQGEPEGIIVPASVLQKARRSGLWVTHG